MGEAEVDFWGIARVQRAGWSFYFKPDGTFHWIRFKPNPMTRPTTLAELTPTNSEQFRDFMRGARMTHTVTVEPTGRPLEEMLQEAIAKLIQLTEL